MLGNTSSRNERNNRIINGIMSGHTPVLLLTPTHPSYLDFLPDLFNNYRTVYVYNGICETRINFVLCLAKKVLSEEDYRIAESFCRCGQQDYKKILLNKVLSEIKKIQNDCLLFLCGLEMMPPSFDYSLLEVLTCNCPDNLKIVFCSARPIHTSYSMMERTFPRVIVCDKESEKLPFYDNLFKDGYLMTEQKEMLYRLSFYPFVDVDYAETVFPGSSEILNALSRNFRSCILKLGGFFCFHPDFHEVAEKYLDNVVEIGEQDKTYVEYLYSTGQYDRALEGTIRLKDKKEYVQKIATGLIISGMEYYLFNVFKEYGELLAGSPLAALIEKCVRRDYEGALQDSYAIKEERVRKKIYYALSHFTNNRENAIHEFCKEIEENPEKLSYYIRIVGLMSYAEEKRLGAMKNFIKYTEEKLKSGDKDVSFLHYVSKVHAAAGNFVIAKKYLTEISSVCDYYAFSYVQSWTFFFTMPIETVSVYAQETGNDLLACCGYLYRGNKPQALSVLKDFTVKNVYTMDGMLCLALQSIFYAEAGNPEFGRSIALLYAVSCEREGRGESALFYTALAYCEWLLRNASGASMILRKCKSGHTDSFFAFLAKALEINCNLERERSSVLEKQIDALFSLAKEKGYDNAIVVLRSCFLPLLAYAEKENIRTDYVSAIYASMMNKKEMRSGGKTIYVKLFGDSAVYLDKREISWKTKKSKDLFLLYYLHKDGIERNKIISEIWSDYVYASAVNNLKTTNNLIRKTLREYGIPFTFSYGNGKYRLNVEYSESDFDAYEALVKEFPDIQDVRRRVNQMGRILSYVDEGFASDCDLPYFGLVDLKNKEEISLFLSDLIRDLIGEGDYLNAKRYLLRLEKIGLFDCSGFKTEIDKMVSKK